MIVYAALDEMHFVNRKLDANHMLPPMRGSSKLRTCASEMAFCCLWLIHMIAYLSLIYM